MSAVSSKHLGKFRKSGCGMFVDMKAASEPFFELLTNFFELLHLEAQGDRSDGQDTKFIFWGTWHEL